MSHIPLNVDPAEIAKFEALAAKWWDMESEFKPLHQINPLRLNWIDERVSLAGKRVLDVGCGGGVVFHRAGAGDVAHGAKTHGAHFKRIYGASWC